MSKNTSIEWCDHTWTPVVGCDPVSPACANCYAALMASRLEAMGTEKYNGVAVRVGSKGKWTGKVNFSEADLVKPLQVRRPGRWFLTSMGDIAHEAVTDEQIAEMFGVMAVAGAAGEFHREQDGYRDQLHNGKLLARWPNYLSGPHTFMVLTKRPQRLNKLLVNLGFRKLAAQAAYKWAHNRTDAGAISGGMYQFGDSHDPNRYWPLPNVFIGCTAEDQQRADELRPHMDSIAIAGWKTFVSYEPALGPVDWTGWEFLHQLISGGESGNKARPSHPDWHRASRDFALRNGIAYLFKQHGDWAEVEGDYQLAPDDAEAEGYNPKTDCVITPDGRVFSNPADLPDDVLGRWMHRAGKKAAGRLLDGRTWDEVPT